MINPVFEIPDGVWPTMITPFTDQGAQIDYAAVEGLVQWYIQKGVAGIFAVCQSSEMFFLSAQERTALAKAVVRCAGGRIPVVVSGHVSDDAAGQLEELKAMADTGASAVVLLPNRLAGQHEGEEIALKNLDFLLNNLDANMPLGLYECPYPFKRLASQRLLQACLDCGRFFFLKDTACDMANLRQKMQLIGGSAIKLFNANSAFLLDSLRAGASGFSGVMANIHPELYVWLCGQKDHIGPEAELLSSFLGLASAIETRTYPMCAKYYHQLAGVKMNLYTRSLRAGNLPPSHAREVEHLLAMTRYVKGRILSAE